MKFHHNQKVLIVSGYYSTFKGRIIDQRLSKDNKVEYNVKIILSKSETIDKWLSEDLLKVSWF